MISALLPFVEWLVEVAMFMLAGALLCLDDYSTEDNEWYILGLILAAGTGLAMYFFVVLTHSLPFVFLGFASIFISPGIGLVGYSLCEHFLKAHDEK